MFKSKLDSFIAKRAAALSLLLAAAGSVFLGSGRWPALGGLLAGSVAGIGRFCGHEWILRNIVFRLSGKTAAAGGIAAFTFSQLVLAAAVAGAYFLDSRFLFGLIAGISAVPAAVMLNSVTETLGITHNHFE